MDITVKDVIVQNDELAYNVEIPFRDLNSKGQERLFLENKDLFLCEALSSRYDDIKNLALNNLTFCCSEALNKAIWLLYKQPDVGHGYIHSNNIYIIRTKILPIPHLVLDPSIRITFSTDDYCNRLPEWVANDVNTPFELLRDMLLPALQNAIHFGINWSGSYGYAVLWGIVNNPNFKKSTEIQSILSGIDDKESFILSHDPSKSQKLIAQVTEILNF